jgi:5-methylcytosine-specific restriction endonuclease McrA
MRTLVLDSTYFPVKIVSWQKAMILLFTGRAEVVTEYADLKVRSVSQSFNLPKILRLVARHRGDKTVRFGRANVYLRDNHQCQYCADHFPTNLLTFDHVIPISRQGRTSWENVVTCCGDCNRRKGNKLPHEVGMHLLRPPRRPNWSPELCLRIKEDDPAEWFEWLPAGQSA